MMYKKLQKVLAVALMTSFLSSSFVVGVSEAAAASHNAGRGPAQQQVRPTQKSAPQQKAQPSMQKSAPQHKTQPSMQKNAPQHKTQPMAHKNGPVHGGPVVVQQQPAPPPQHHSSGYRSMHSGDWLGALIVGGIIGAVIANSSHHTADTVEYAAE